MKELTDMTSYFLTQRDYVLPIDRVHGSREGYGHHRKTVYKESKHMLTIT